MTTTERPRFVGTRVRSRNGARFVRGAGRYIDDIHLPRELTLVLLRSPHPHARIVSIDTTKARAADGVVAVATGAELFEAIGPQSYLWQLPGQKVGPGRPLAIDKVRHVGEPVVAVVARDQYAAEDALELIDVVYEPLRPVNSYEDALAADAALLHEEWGDNVQVRTAWPLVIPGLPEPPDAGAALDGAELVLGETFEIGRMTATSMETRGVVCDYNPAGPSLTIWTSTQSPHQIRQGVSAVLGLPENRIRVIAPDVGGAFGMKAVMYPEEALVPYFALTLRRPVRYIEQRSESFVAATPSRAQRITLELGFDRDGHILGLRSRYLLDLGSAPSTCGAGTGWVTGALLCGPYAVPAVDIAGTAVVTNKSPLGAFRGFGQPEGNFAMERLLDIAARRLDIDSVELRRRNLAPADAFPYTNATGMLFDSGDYTALLNLAVAHPAYTAALAERDAARAEGRRVGIGLAFYNECTNFGPSGVFPLIGITQGGWDATTIAIEPDGRIRVTLGQTPMGQGIETAMAAQAADAFGVDLADVTVHFGDTDSSHYTGYASGASPARPGSAARPCWWPPGWRRRSCARSRRICSRRRPTTSKRVRRRVRGAPSGTRAGVARPHRARCAIRPRSLPEGMSPGLEFLGTFDPVALAFSYGVVIALVELDADTGQVSVRRLIVGHDCGNQLNPAIVEGQLIGGMVQGLGTALLEDLPYDEHGTAAGAELPGLPAAAGHRRSRASTCSTPRPPTPFALNGAKGVGESGRDRLPRGDRQRDPGRPASGRPRDHRHPGPTRTDPRAPAELSMSDHSHTGMGPPGSVSLLGSTTPPEDIARLAREVERAGFGELWIPEDYFFLGGIAATGIALGATERIPVGLSVVSVDGAPPGAVGHGDRDPEPGLPRTSPAGNRARRTGLDRADGPDGEVADGRVAREPRRGPRPVGRVRRSTARARSTPSTKWSSPIPRPSSSRSTPGYWATRASRSPGSWPRVWWSAPWRRWSTSARRGRSSTPPRGPRDARYGPNSSRWSPPI